MTDHTAISFHPYAKQAITSEDIQAMEAVFRGEIITRGPQVAEFEAAVASYVGASYAVAFNSGSSALRAAAFAAETKGGDRWITTPNSFVATAVAGAAAGAVPVFVDIDGETGNLNLEQLQYNLEQKPSRGRNIVVPVHYAGIPVNMKTIDASIRDTDTILIEDGAAALGSTYDGERRVGCCEWSHMTVFSFHPAKLLTTGEGGLVTTNDPHLDYRLRLYRNNGIVREPDRLSENPGPWYYEVVEMTGNYNVTDFQAALGLSQLSRIHNTIRERQQVIAWYRKYLEGVAHVKLLPALKDSRVSPHLAVVLIDFEEYRKERSLVMTQLRDNGIGSQVHYIPIYRHPAFQQVSGILSDYFPASEHFYARTLSLPLYNGLKEEEVKRVCQTLSAVLEGKLL